MNAEEVMIKDTLRQLDGYMLQALDLEEQQLQEQLRATIEAGGKRLRPTLVLLSARLCNPEIATEAVLPLAAAVEMVHTASLIHDDVIDDSTLRRGHPSLHTRVGRRKAVLYGDYLLTKALSLLDKCHNPALYALLARVAGEMCLGEFQQMDSAFSLEKQTMSQYFQRIRRKTAGLLTACCRAGAIVGGAGSAAEEALSRYGEYLGIAFQLSDDILDFADSAAVGKPRGQDLRQGVFTPPLLFALKHSRQAEKLAAYAQKRNKSVDELQFLLQEVKESGGLAETQRLVLFFIKKAAAALAVFPDSAEKSALLAVSAGIQDRKQ